MDRTNVRNARGLLVVAGKGTGALFWAVAALWTLDVLINLDLPGRWVRGRPFYCTSRDFVGLLAGEVQVALAALIAGLAGFAVAQAVRARIGTPSRNRAFGLLRTAAAALALPVFLAQSRTLWGYHPAQTLPVAALTLIPTALIWLALPLLAPHNPHPKRPIARTWSWFFLPAWGLSALNQAAAAALHADWYTSFVGAGSALAAAALLARTQYTRREGPANLLPAALALSLATGYTIAFHQYGLESTADIEIPPRQEPAPGTIDPPNVVLVVLDTVRADHLQRFGYHRNPMPGLEQWAQNALSFARAVSPAGWTAPAHASLFSGLPVSQHGIHHGSRSGGGGDVYQTPAHPGIRWLPERLAELGFECTAVTANPVALPPDVTGFHRVFQPWHEGWYDGTLAALVDNHSPLSRTISERLRWRLPYLDAQAIADIAARAARPRGRPLFLFLNFLDAHSPYNPPHSALKAIHAHPSHPFPRYLPHNTLTQIWSTLPPSRKTCLDDLYDGELRWIDQNLTPLLETLQHTLGPNTVFIVTSDHGEDLGEGGRVGHEFGLAQHIVHVPLFLKAPHLKPGTVDTPVSTRRLHDFILHIAQSGKADPAILWKPDPVHLVAERYPYHDSIRVFGPEYDRPWVVMYMNGFKGEGPGPSPFRLLDVTSHGFEQEMETTNPDMARRLKLAIDSYWSTYRDTRGLNLKAPDSATLDMLTELGYVTE